MARMSPSEAIMWAAEKDPALRSDFSNLTLLDGMPDVDRLRDKVEQALISLPRLAERVVSPPLRLAPPEWRPDPTLDLSYHLRRVALPEPGTLRDLLDLAASISAPPLDRSRPLWEFTLIEGMADGRAALLQRVHHTVTDGVGGLKLSLSLVDFERDPEPTIHDTVRAIDEEEKGRQLHEVLDDPLTRDSPLGVLRDAMDYAVAHNFDLARRGISAGADIALHPTAAPRRMQDAVGLVGSLRRQVLVGGGPRSPLLADALSRASLRRVHGQSRGLPLGRPRAGRHHQRHLRHRRVRRARSLPRPARHARRGSPHGDGRQHPQRRQRRGQPVRPDPGHRADHAQGAGRRASTRCGTASRTCATNRRSRPRTASPHSRPGSPPPSSSACCAARPARPTSRPRTSAAARSSSTSAVPASWRATRWGPAAGVR